MLAIKIFVPYTIGLMQNIRNSTANAVELRLFCIKPSTDTSYSSATQ